MRIVLSIVILIIVILSAYSIILFTGVEDEKEEDSFPLIENVYRGSDDSEWICNIREYNEEIYFLKNINNLSDYRSITRPNVEDHLRLYKITKEGQIIELFKWGEKRIEWINDFYIDATGIYCVGSTFEGCDDLNITRLGDGIVNKFAFNGSLLWTYRWDVEYRDSFHSIEKFGDGMILGGRYEKRSFPYEEVNELVYIYQDGEIIWNTTMIIEGLLNGISEIYDILTLEDRVYIIGSIPDPFGGTKLGYIFGVDLNGNVVIGQIFNEDYVQEGANFFYDVDIADQNTLVVGCSNRSIIKKDAPKDLEIVILNYSRNGISHSCLLYSKENSTIVDNEFIFSYKIYERWGMNSLMVESMNGNGEVIWNITYKDSNDYIFWTKLLLLNTDVYILINYSDIIKISS